MLYHSVTHNHNIPSVFLKKGFSVENSPRQFDIGVTPTADAFVSGVEVRSWRFEVGGSRLEVRG